MRRVWVGLALALLSSTALGVEFFPIYVPPPQAYGVTIKAIRGDASKLYLLTEERDLIALDKQELLTGIPTVEYLSASRWGKEFSARATSAIEALERPSDAASFGAVPWRAGSTRVHIKPAYCEEGLQEFHELRIDGLKVDTGMGPCMDFTPPVLLDGRIWMGTYTPGEYAYGPGVGVLVFDLERRQRVFQIRRSLGPGDEVSMLADEERGGVWIVNRSAIHFYNREFQLLAKWYYSEQMDPTARNWSVLELTKQPKPHDAFAVIGRIINTPPELLSGNDEEVETALRGKRWVSTKGVGTYQRSLSRLPKTLHNGFWLYYDEFERRLIPMWRKSYMDKEHGGKKFIPARDLIICLHALGEGRRSWQAEDFVQRLLDATLLDRSGDHAVLAPTVEPSKNCPAF